MKVICVIPARYASSRLPGKPLADICGKPMIRWVYEQAKQAKLLEDVIVATDNSLVYEAVQNFAGKVCMTSAAHTSGTDRLAEVAQHYPEVDLIVNVQGDEPLIPSEIIDRLVTAFLQEPDLQMATLKTVMPASEYADPACVKVVTDYDNNALYFSRSQIPYVRNKLATTQIYKHIGIYAYKRDFLLKFASLPVGYLEQIESLEQLRVLENGYKIKVLEVAYNAVGVDTPEDLEKVRKVLATR